MSTITWHDEATIHGIQVKAFFFDGKSAQEETDIHRRALPMLVDAPVKPVLVATESDRRNFHFENLVAQPDTVFSHGSGLICVEYKFVGYRDHSRQRWKREIRLVDMLQNIVASYVVAQELKKVTACVLRYHNVAYLLTPQPALIAELRRLAPLGMTYIGDRKRIAARQLADFAETRIEKLYPGQVSARSAQGKVAHDTLLRRDAAATATPLAATPDADAPPAAAPQVDGAQIPVET